jgi:hypothetical protein
MRQVLLAAALLALPAAAPAMTVGRFVAIAEGLEAKGMAAVFSSDIKLLKAEFMQAGKALKAERTAAIKAGRKPAFCPPKEARLNSKELLAHFRAVPPSQRDSVEVREALRDLMARKFPC